MKYLSLPLLVVLLISGTGNAYAYTLNISKSGGGFSFDSHLQVNDTTKANHVNIDGRYNEWRCSAWTNTRAGGLEVACYTPNTRDRFNVHSLIRCDADDFMYVDGVNITCR